MATVTISNVTTRSALVIVSGLQYPANQYDRIKFQFYQNNILVIDTYVESVNSSTTIYIDFSNDSSLGYNWFTPDTTYKVKVIPVYNGVEYDSLNSPYFTTDSTTPPSGSITPSVFTKIKNQGQYNNCVPMSLSTVMEIFKAKQTGITYEEYSASFIWGNGGYDWGMYYKEAIIDCSNEGSPRWELAEKNAETKSFYDSTAIYANADSYAKSNALLQKYDGYQNIDFYDCASVKAAIQNYGCFLFTFRIPNNFYYVGSDGIVPQPDSYVNVNHSIALIGLTTKNGKPHWIAQNSWGTDWGANGICYIPYDWGIGVQAPDRYGYLGTPSSWTTECYSVWNTGISSSNPAKPTNISAVKTGDKSALVTWESAVSGALFTVFASKKNSGDWYIKGRTTNKSLAITFDNYDTYEIRVLASVSNLYSDNSIIAIVTMLNILPWEWFTPKTDSDVKVTRAEWLAFCAKINEVRVANGLSAYGFTTSTTYIDKDKPFYAWIWLQAANAINDLGTGVASACLNVKSYSVSQGDDSIIYPWYFENLKTALNNAINF